MMKNRNLTIAICQVLIGAGISLPAFVLQIIGHPPNYLLSIFPLIGILLMITSPVWISDLVTSSETKVKLHE